MHNRSTRALKGWTTNRIRCINYAITLIDATVEKVRADLLLSGDEGTLRDLDLHWHWASGALIKAPGILRAEREEADRHRERKKGRGVWPPR